MICNDGLFENFMKNHQKLVGFRSFGSVPKYRPVLFGFFRWVGGLCIDADFDSQIPMNNSCILCSNCSGLHVSFQLDTLSRLLFSLAMNTIELFHGIAAATAATSSARTIPAKAPIFKKNSPFQDFPRRQHHFPPSVTSSASLGNCRPVSKITCLKMDRSVGGLTYRDAGVDIDAGSELVRRIAKMAPGIGGFGGLFPLGDSFLVAGTDGVGTKLKLAFETGIHDTIGIDLVAMSVNDIVTSGAKPLFFLDYFATSHLDVDLAEKVIRGIVDGCQQSDCALLGGEMILRELEYFELMDG